MSCRYPPQIKRPEASPRYRSLLILVCLILWSAAPARAVLGEPESSVPTLAKTWRSARLSPLAAGKFHVLEVDDAGVSVREYVGPDGKVFAVTWRGMRQPNLSRLLGSYHGELRAAEKQRPARRALRGPMMLKTLNTTSYRAGRMRDIRGRVFLTDHLPEGVREEDLE